MAYNPLTDWLGLLRQQSSGQVTGERVPGLDYVVAALARAGLINLSVGQTPPLSNQLTTAWFKPASPSWSAEGVLYLWNPTASAYQIATPALWALIFAPLISGYVFASTGNPSAVIQPGVSLFAIQRSGAVATALTLPNMLAQFASTRKLQIIDFSIGVTSHAITMVTPDGAFIQNPNQNSLELLNNGFGTGVTLQPSPDLNAWIVAP